MNPCSDPVSYVCPFALPQLAIRWQPGRRLTWLAQAMQWGVVGGLMAIWQPSVYGQNVRAAAQASVQQQPTQHYHIAAGPLDEVLARFANESGVVLASTPEQVLGSMSPGAQGTYSASEALAVILAGTGLESVPNSAGGFFLRDIGIGEDVGVGDGGGTLAAVTVVSAAGYAQDIRNAAASISVVTSEDLEKHQFSSLQDIARDIPGVSVIGSGAQSGISIRGMEKGYTLILIDGKRVRSETGNPRELNNEDLDSSFIPPLAAIDRIEVIRGPMSSLYGSDAMGGVINIITKRNPETWSGSVGLGMRAPDSGSMGNQRQKDVYLAGPVIKDLVSASVWASDIDQDEDRYFGGYQESSKRNLGGKLRVTPIRNHEISLDYTHANQHFTGSPGAVLMPDARRSIDREWKRTAKDISYDGSFDLGVLELQYHQEDYSRFTYPQNVDYTTGSTNQVADARFVTGLDQHVLTVGAQWTQDTLSNNELGGGANLAFGSRSVSEKALFAEDEWELISQKLFLTLGARLTHNAFFGNQVSPRTYLVFNHNDSWTFKGGIATGYKSPRLGQIDSGAGSQRGGGADQFLAVGNPDLRPETSTNFELGTLFHHNDTFRFGATAFHNDFANKILNTSTYYFDDGQGGRIAAYCDSGPVGSLNCPAWATWLNARKAKIRGLELDGAWAVSNSVNLKGNYTFTDSKVNAGDVTINTPAGPRSFGDTLAGLDGNSLVGIPKHNGSVMLDYRPIASWLGFVRFNYEGQISSVNFETISIDRSEKNLATLDAGFRYSLNRHFSFNFGIDNITNAKRFDVNTDTGAYRFSERGRSYYTALKAQF